MRIRLVEPTDFKILNALVDGHRDIATNLAVRLEIDRSYLNTRLPVLADYDLIDKVGPAANSGLYQITPRGVAAVQYQPLYEADRDEFTSMIKQRARNITIESPTVADTHDESSSNS